MPQMGSDELMRGYYTGRYRDRNYIAGQAELRYRIVKSFGIVGFVGTGEVFRSTFTFPELKPNYGGGLRYFFDIQKGLSVRVDYGVGSKPAGEKRETGLYVGLGQAF
jgi:outer membrane translocation and assembly module TamA